MRGFEDKAVATERRSRLLKRLRASCLAAGLLGALGLGGCATSHVGNDWQCPLTQGERCLSVASADPVAPQRNSGDPDGSVALATDTPLYRAAPDEGTGAATSGGSQRPLAKCGGGCRPLAWVSRLFGHRAGAGSDGDRIEAEDEAPTQAEASLDADASTPDAERRTDNPQEPAAAQRLAVPQGPAAPQGLRTAEVIGRIWIAPYVDSGGVYHEASWVRVVLEPAGWKRP